MHYDYIITKREFDSSGNLVFECPGYAYFRKMEYNSSGLCIYDEITWQPKRIGGTPEVFWIKYEYDSYGIAINETNSHGEWKKSIRNDDGSYSVLNDDGIESTYIYNTSGNVISIKSSDGTWSKYEYDSNGNETVYENSHGFWFIADYDFNNNIVNMDYQKTVIKF
jgi:YD repeat-containing protein